MSANIVYVIEEFEKSLLRSFVIDCSVMTNGPDIMDFVVF